MKIRAGLYNFSHANAPYNAKTESPPTRPMAASIKANEVTGRVNKGFASNEPMPIAKTNTANTIDVCWMDEPIKNEPKEMSANSYTKPQAAIKKTTNNKTSFCVRDPRCAVFEAVVVIVVTGAGYLPPPELDPPRKLLPLIG